VSSDSPCELHEIWPCAICNGDEARLREADRVAEVAVRIAPGVVLAVYPGHCARCGLNFGEESPIRYSAGDSGWIALGCCG
jgi:predicted Zn-ribbon and HTH transcriptional regulator